MAFADTIAALNQACARTLGESVTHEAAVGGAQTVCDCVLTRRTEPTLVGGQITIDESHYRGQIPTAQLAAVARGDRIIAADGRRYQVVEHPRAEEQMWQLVLGQVT
jgi:hypothetical protein